MDQKFTYNGWTFSVVEDGSLNITPTGHQESGVFGEPKQTTTMQSITLPREEVHRLIGYCITRDTENTNVLKGIQNLEQQYGLVKSK